MPGSVPPSIGESAGEIAHKTALADCELLFTDSDRLEQL